MKMKSIIQLSSSCLTRRSSGVIFKNNKELESTGFRIKSGMTRLAQSGSIMLEVVAVLALMGVMGAMLFRQIYQRNQELHNIQMASEIRTVKEAFSAYIQANRASIVTECGHITPNEIVTCSQENDAIASSVCEYLPAGWFGDDLRACQADGGLKDAYSFSMYAYRDPTGRDAVYGIVVPTTATLPTTGWNFRRAARVALLVGADGGAYHKTITKGEIAGSLGSWHIVNCEEGGSCIIDNDYYPNGTYVANTGLDIFAPEYEMPEGKVGIPAEWNLALRNLHAYNYFSVGNAETGDCYSIETDTTPGGRSIRKYDGAGENAVVISDAVYSALSDTCKPLFWVGSDNGGNPTSGNVYVQNDLNVGADMTGTGNHALKLTAEGVIKQKDGLTINKDGRIIARETVSADIGDLKQGEHFVLDPAYTSTMNDIRLTSRGGVRLSDILPNYILKDTYDTYCTLQPDGHPKIGSITPTNSDSTDKADQTWCDVSYVVNTMSATASGNNDATMELPYPNCPTDYKMVAMVIPTHFGQKSFIQTKQGHTHTTNSVDGTSSHSHTVYGATYDSDAKKSGASGAAGDQFVSDVEGCAFFAQINNKDSTGPVKSLNDPSKKFIVTLGYRKTDQGSNHPTPCPVNNGKTETMHATVQTYCVWSPSLYDGKKASCLAAGYFYNISTDKCGVTQEYGKGTSVRNDGNAEFGVSVKSSEVSKETCEAAGFKWVAWSGLTPDIPAHCQYIYINPTEVNSLSGIYKRDENGNVLGSESSADLLRRKAAVCKAAGYKWDGATCSE